MDNVEDRILKAAMKLFVKEGYKGATTLKIAHEAGVNEITLFRNFKSKENILKEVIARNWEEAHEKLDKILLLDKDLDIPESLRTEAEGIRDFLDDQIDLLTLLIVESIKRPEVAGVLSTFPQKMVKHFVEYFDEQIKRGNIRDVNSEVAAIMLISYIYYNSFLKRMMGKEVFDEREILFEDFIEIFSRGIIK
ncbi:MAG: TetR/AcrR family transcriptional regulator [Euryarchaeota archaeon]|nr:TetR/AcrR family transcriptional regulator [Euryarchaeota archaeon]